MIDLFNSLWIEFLYKPIFNLVVITYNLTPGPSFGLALIGLALLIRFIFLYFTLQGYKHEEELASVHTQISKIEKDKSLSNKEKLQKISTITKPFGINPVFSAVPIFAQILFLGVLYQIIQVGIYGDGFHNLYNFVHNPVQVNTIFFGFELAKPNLLLSLLAAFTLFLERIWEYGERKEIGESFAVKWDPLIWPLGTFIILIILPSAKAVFLITSIVFSIVIKGIIHINRPKPAKVAAG